MYIVKIIVVIITAAVYMLVFCVMLVAAGGQLILFFNWKATVRVVKFAWLYFGPKAYLRDVKQVFLSLQDER